MSGLDTLSVLGEVGKPGQKADGTNQKLRLGNFNELVTSQAHGKYSEASRRGNLFMAHAIVTAPVIYTTAAGTGGPLLWNGSSTVKANLLAVGFGISVVTTVAASLGITGNIGQPSAPTTTTAIDSRANLLIGGAASACTPYRIGTVANAGGFFLPFANLHTGALTVDNTGLHWMDLNGLITVPPGAWVSVAASATATTTVAQIALIWEEIPV